MGLEHWSGALVRWRDTAEIAPAPGRFFGARKHLQSFFAVAFFRRRFFVGIHLAVDDGGETDRYWHRGGTRGNSKESSCGETW